METWVYEHRDASRQRALEFERNIILSGSVHNPHPRLAVAKAMRTKQAKLLSREPVAS